MGTAFWSRVLAEVKLALRDFSPITVVVHIRDCLEREKGVLRAFGHCGQRENKRRGY